MSGSRSTAGTTIFYLCNIPRGRNCCRLFRVHKGRRGVLAQQHGGRSAAKVQATRERFATRATGFVNTIRGLFAICPRFGQQIVDASRTAGGHTSSPLMMGIGAEPGYLKGPIP